MPNPAPSPDSETESVHGLISLRLLGTSIGTIQKHNIKSQLDVLVVDLRQVGKQLIDRENILEDLHDETKGMASKRAEPHKIGHSQHTAPGGKEGEFWHTAEH